MSTLFIVPNDKFWYTSDSTLSPLDDAGNKGCGMEFKFPETGASLNEGCAQFDIVRENLSL